jgi:hypothetical protein
MFEGFERFEMFEEFPNPKSQIPKPKFQNPSNPKPFKPHFPQSLLCSISINFLINSVTKP